MELAEYRTRAFAHFLCNVIDHPVLHSDHVLHLFLVDPRNEWRSTVLKYEPSPVKGNAGRQPKALDRVITELLDVIGPFEASAKSLQLAQRFLYKKAEEFKGTGESLGTAYNGFSLECAALSPALDAIGELHDKSSASFAGLLQAQQKICEQIEEIVAYLAAIRRAIRNYTAFVCEFESLCERIGQSRSALLTEGGGGAYEHSGSASLGNSSRQPAIAQLEQSQFLSRSELDRSCTLLVVQISTWLSRQRTVWGDLLSDIAQMQTAFAKEIQEGWHSQRMQMEGCDR